ncbi:Predicted Fe2+/Mn2+ transporter, VIT1/CCC1 family [Roseovarius marisflavi]|uniref:Predicted Fe2+/Mn2+ transporter, VIT1/CCC1 family n=1 Tax=Roseovarius marisflavi TaxID=1054996 RepID=A0A1M6VIB3_9RHOB|nr:VIT1/CCC1 transporter family protein [Roseovarius marisflavi]SHK81210.1 Predicted Fe2+/Mn2+ transporter, VIT1/CCC1 family [Roseovarius marisflavi]
MDRQADGRDGQTLGRTQEYLKQIVFGGTDGIVTTFAIVAGFAGAQAEGVAQIGGLAVLVFGLANLFADAVSMGLGEFLSLRAQHDLYRSRHAASLRALVQNPDGQTAVMTDLLSARGLSQSEAQTTATILSRHPGAMAELILNYEMGLRDPEVESPVLNGLFTFSAFVTFGVVPLVPYLLFDATAQTTRWSVAATLVSLLLLGFLRWTATGERLLRTLGETVLVGTVCALVAFVVGALVGG